MTPEFASLLGFLALGALSWGSHRYRKWRATWDYGYDNPRLQKKYEPIISHFAENPSALDGLSSQELHALAKYCVSCMWFRGTTNIQNVLVSIVSHPQTKADTVYWVRGRTFNHTLLQATQKAPSVPETTRAHWALMPSSIS